MGSVNKVILVGNLGRDIELRYTAGGTAVATLNMATTDVWNDKSGQRQEKTEWHRVVLWGKTAESLAEYLLKGRQIYVEGRLQTRQWDDRDGNKRVHDRDSGPTAWCFLVGAEVVLVVVAHAVRVPSSMPQPQDPRAMSASSPKTISPSRAFCTSLARLSRLPPRARSRAENRVGLTAGHAACGHLQPRPRNQIHNLHRHSAADASRLIALGATLHVMKPVLRFFSA